MSNFVLVHGAWHGGWCWECVAALLRDEGYQVFTPTLSGLAERRGELSRAIGLSTHIADIVDLVRDADLRDVTLVGHSYGGFPATAAASRLGGRVRRLILLDAFLPADGEMLLDHAPMLIERYAEARDGDPDWHIPPLPSAAFGVGDADQAWVDARLTPQPVGSYFERIRCAHPMGIAHKSYIRCTRAPGELLERSLARVRQTADWHYAELDASHDAMITHPQALARLLAELAGTPKI
ncbi:alpha/beta fold hydrolase [Brenneria tiliae]|uniref:alpha/beta fold hydrolase n=1 Tax=Brenneria tiliae TaxID=2914984 RepID=UPI002014CA92|nr:alpha/beta fold hydrolase [Brenneria tiliae]MCL2898242.1 alpha/beta hydrolase [Brenneria tiliae]MCL2902592.1 alpha/beta hydrolase [Brenneria tiliae]